MFDHFIAPVLLVLFLNRECFAVLGSAPNSTAARSLQKSGDGQVPAKHQLTLAVGALDARPLAVRRLWSEHLLVIIMTTTSIHSLQIKVKLIFLISK